MNQSKPSYLSPLTIGFGTYIIISASFIQQIWKFLGQILGKGNVETICIAINLIIGLLILCYIIKYRFNLLRFIAVSVILIAAYTFAWRQPYFVEKIHVLEYGLLGWLATKDLRRFSKINILQAALFSLLFALFIGSLDEGFQRLLPYRVGEMRDVLTNIISGSFGIVLFLISK